MQGSVIHITLVLAQATVGVIILAAALQRYFFGKLPNWLSFVLFIGSLLLIYPDWRLTAAGLTIAGGIMILQKARYRDTTGSTAANS